MALALGTWMAIGLACGRTSEPPAVVRLALDPSAVYVIRGEPGEPADAGRVATLEVENVAQATTIAAQTTTIAAIEARLTTAQGALAAAEAAAALFPRPCPADMVTVGDFCIDRYEASVWSNPACDGTAACPLG